MSRLRGADALALTLARAGVKRIFTVSGNHVMSVFDATLDAGIGLVHTRHEAAAVHMADAWARLTGEIGVALVTGGPGHANALAALLTAREAESPVVLLSGHAPLADLGRGAFQELRQADMALPVSKAAWTATRADGLAAEIARAVAIARTGRRGPVHVSLPTDVLEAPVHVSLPGVEAFAPASAPLAAHDAAAILDRLARAKRPVIVAGPPALAHPGREHVRELAHLLDLPVVGMESPRGPADPSLGAFASMLAQADCLLLLGKRVDFVLRYASPPAIAADCEIVQVDPEAAEFERTRRAIGARLVAAFVADTTGALTALVAAARARPRHPSTWGADVRAAIEYRPAAWDGARCAEALHPVQVCRPLQALLDAHADAVLVSDGGEFGQWAQACLRAPHRVINGPAGAIGAALPMALAARLVHRDAPVLALTGDGAFGFHVAEIDTGVRHRLPVIAVVGNDARWNAEHQIQLRTYGPERLVGCDLLPTRYDRVAVAFGGYGEHVEAADEVVPAVRRAASSGLPACVDVHIAPVAAPAIGTRTP